MERTTIHLRETLPATHVWQKRHSHPFLVRILHHALSPLAHLEPMLPRRDQLQRPEVPISDKDLERVSFSDVPTVFDSRGERFLELLLALCVPGREERIVSGGGGGGGRTTGDC